MPSQFLKTTNCKLRKSYLVHVSPGRRAIKHSRLVFDRFRLRIRENQSETWGRRTCGNRRRTHISVHTSWSCVERRSLRVCELYAPGQIIEGYRDRARQRSSPLVGYAYGLCICRPVTVDRAESERNG